MKHMRKICACLLSLLLVLGLGHTAFAAGSVTYDGNAREFIFLPGSEEAPTDLFSDFKNVMPGDTVTQEIQIRNDTSRKVKIRVYLRSLGAQEDTEDFLSQLKLTVAQKEDTILFDAPADQTAQLTDWVYLGTVYSGGEITLQVTLEVPAALGNGYQHQTGYIDWEFKIEELPVGPADPEPPKTGDDSHIWAYGILLPASLLALILLVAHRKKKETQNP